MSILFALAAILSASVPDDVECVCQAAVADARAESATVRPWRRPSFGTDHGPPFETLARPWASTPS